jgi:hypothetical protein
MIYYIGNTCWFSSPDDIHGRNEKQRDFGGAACEILPLGSVSQSAYHRVEHCNRPTYLKKRC